MLNVITSVDAENIVNYNFGLAAVIGIIIIILIVGVIIGFSGARRTRKIPE